jgi:hypothetical protein
MRGMDPDNDWRDHEIETDQSTIFGLRNRVFVRREPAGDEDPGGDRVRVTGILSDTEMPHVVYTSDDGVGLRTAAGNLVYNLTATWEAFIEVYRGESFTDQVQANMDAVTERLHALMASPEGLS